MSDYIKIFIASMIVFVGMSLSSDSEASMNLDHKLVLETERNLLLATLKLCCSPDVKTLISGLPDLSQQMEAVNVEPDQLNETFASSGLVNFSAWGFSDAQNALDKRSFFVKIMIQEASCRTVTFCQVTDMTTDETATPLALVEADWLKAIEPWTASAKLTCNTQSPETATHDATFERYFDLSTPQAVQSIHTLRVKHKLELTLLRAKSE